MISSKNRTTLSLAEIASRVGGELGGDGNVQISAVAPIQHAGDGDISFVANRAYTKFIETTGASALVLDPDTACGRCPVIRHENPYLTIARIVDLLYPETPLVAPGCHDSAVIAPDVHLDEPVAIGPLCHVREGSRIGRHGQLVSSVFVGRNVTIGSHCLLYPGVQIMDGCTVGDNVIIHSGAVIGSDGFGFAQSESGLKKVRQVGWVEIGDDVEIGANTTVDRGSIGPTRIGRGTKIDNLVQIAHNVEIGENCIIVSQVGISGSTRIGDGVRLAGQVGLIGHIEIGHGVRVGAQSGVAKSVPAGKTMFGSPARDIMETKKIEAALAHLPQLLKRVRDIEKRSRE